MHSGPTAPGQRSPISIGNALHWKFVDKFTLLEAACLWVGIEPLDHLGDLSVSPEAAASYHMLTRAIEDGRLVAYPPNPAPRTVIAPAGGQHAPNMLVSREDLLELANAIGTEPPFLFLSFGKAAQSRAQPRPRTYSKAALKAWYRQRVEQWPADKTPPSREQDWQAAKEQGFPNVPRKAVRELRNELAPSAWSQKGGRPRRK